MTDWLWDELRLSSQEYDELPISCRPIVVGGYDDEREQAEA